MFFLREKNINFGTVLQKILCQFLNCSGSTLVVLVLYAYYVMLYGLCANINAIL